MNPKEFGASLKRIRRKKELTLLDLGEKTGFSKSYLSIIENGKQGIPKPETLRRLADGLNISYKFLLIEAGYLNEDSPSKLLHGSPIEPKHRDIVEISMPEFLNYKDENGVDHSRNTHAEDLFNLYFLLHMDVELYYKDTVITPDNRKKILTMLQTILE